MQKIADEERIRKIQDRIELLRKEKFKQTQEKFARRIGVTINVYKNNVNHSKTPYNIEKSDFLNRISIATGISLNYLKLQTDNMYDRIADTVAIPIDFSPRKEQENQLFEYLSETNNFELVKALCFLLVTLPPEYSVSYKEMILSTYHAVSKLSFMQNPELLNNSTYKTITNNLETHNMWVFKQKLLECEADEYLQKKRRHSALQKYIESLLISPDDYTKINTTLPIRKFNFTFPAEKRIGEKIFALTQSWNQYKNNKWKDYEIAVIEAVLSHFA